MILKLSIASIPDAAEEMSTGIETVPDPLFGMRLLKARTIAEPLAVVVPRNVPLLLHSSLPSDPISRAAFRGALVKNVMLMSFNVGVAELLEPEYKRT